MTDFFPIETPYNSEDYKMMKAVVNKGIDSHLKGFTKSEFKKSPNWNNKFLWNIHTSEMPILYRRLEELYNETGNYDYQDFLDSIKEADKQEEPVSEMIDPFNPMDINQTNNGEPTATSDLANDSNVMPEETEIRKMIRQELHAIAQEGIESTVDNTNNTFIPPQNEIEESDSDSLRNQYGANSKPETLGETTDVEKYEDVVFMQGEEAEEPLNILKSAGPEAAIEYLKQWHNPGQHMGNHELNHGTSDKTFEKDGYLLSWNPHVEYIGLQYDTESGLEEDSLTRRHLAGQREKIGDIPLGQHSPHAQATMKEDEKPKYSYSAF